MDRDRAEALASLGEDGPLRQILERAGEVSCSRSIPITATQHGVAIYGGNGYGNGYGYGSAYGSGSGSGIGSGIGSGSGSGYGYGCGDGCGDGYGYGYGNGYGNGWGDGDGDVGVYGTTVPYIECAPVEGITVMSVVVLPFGWVVVGEMWTQRDRCGFNRGVVVRRWNTSRGIGELARGPGNALLDPLPTPISWGADVFTMAVSEAGRASWLAAIENTLVEAGE
jgi:hypothetical protein